jgi:hypothetical protein
MSVKPPRPAADITGMSGRDESLALSYAASDAYQNEVANFAFIDAAVEELRASVEISDHEYAQLIERFHAVLATNRTAPSVMRIMALADEARLAGEEGRYASRRRERRYWQKRSAKAQTELIHQLAATLDALIREPY